MFKRDVVAHLKHLVVHTLKILALLFSRALLVKLFLGGHNYAGEFRGKGELVVFVPAVSTLHFDNTFQHPFAQQIAVEHTEVTLKRNCIVL